MKKPRPLRKQAACQTLLHPRLLSVAWLGLAIAPSLAHAQSATYFDRNHNLGVLDRPRPDYQALGVEAGGFTIFPSLTISPEYDDNIFAADRDRVGDEVTLISPQVQVRSKWSRNEVDAFARLTSDVYASQSNESTTDYQLGASGRLDVLRQDNVTASVDYGHFTEPRTAENTVQDSSTPIQYDAVNARLGSVQTLNRLRFSEQVGVDRYDYQNTTDFSGAFLSQAYRNESAVVTTGRADYALSPELSLFVAESFTDTLYDQKPPQTLLNRDFISTETTVGTDFDITRVVRGQVQIGYLHDTYTSSVYKPVDGPAVHARVEYFLSGLTTLSANINRSVLDSADAISSSVLDTQGGVRIDHELLRNVILSGQANYETDKFQGVDREDRRTSFSASGTYLLSRHLGLTAGYSFLNEASSGSARITPYTVDVISLSFVLQL